MTTVIYQNFQLHLISRDLSATADLFVNISDTIVESQLKIRKNN